ncbi:MAG: hypothetical protein RIT81_19340 [Deltaproteobacteria bacterium]
METSESGVDLTLIDYMLSLSPLERLRENERAIATLEALRRAREVTPDGTRPHDDPHAPDRR